MEGLFETIRTATTTMGSHHLNTRASPCMAVALYHSRPTISTNQKMGQFFHPRADFKVAQTARS